MDRQTKEQEGGRQEEEGTGEEGTGWNWLGGEGQADGRGQKSPARAPL